MSPNSAEGIEALAEELIEDRDEADRVIGKIKVRRKMAQVLSDAS